MIDELLRKHNLEEQDLVKNCDALSDSEKTRLVHMLDRAMESTNGHLTDEKVKFIAETTERLSEVVSGLFRKSASEDKLADERFNKIEKSMEDLNAKMSTMSKEAKANNDNIMKALETNLNEIKELQIKSAKRDGREEAQSQQVSEDSSSANYKTTSAFMRWISDNQFFIFIIIVLIAIQGGNIGRFLMDLSTKLFN